MNNNNTNLILIEDLIKQAKKHGVVFGKTDPYNRLRYYTKIGLLPHMERRKDYKNEIKAYYPHEALKDLIKIEQLKIKGFNNEQIKDFLLKERQKTNIVKELSKYNIKKYLYLSGIAISIFLYLAYVSNMISLSNLYTQSTSLPLYNKEFRILDSGTGIIKAGKKNTFIRSNKVLDANNIQIAFKSNISPANEYKIENIVPEEGFIISLDNQTTINTTFNWWILSK